MEQVFQSFYHDFYLKSGGYMPTQPINFNMFPGDFFQIRNKEIIPLGNIYLNNLISAENSVISEPKVLNNANWNFQRDISKPFSGTGVGKVDEQQIKFSRQVVKFEKWGSFLFKAEKPESISISNWNYIRDELIIKLTQTQFSFRELYLVTESVMSSAWTLAVCGGKKGKLEIATDVENFGHHELFGHESTKVIQSKELEYYHREFKRKPNFFKAKKLVVQEDPLQVFISDLINQKEGFADWANRFYDYSFDYDLNSSRQLISENYKASMLDMLAGGELNPNTALQYFRWTDANLDDINQLFDSDERR